MVPVGGLEPPRLSATDFESVVSTNSTTLAWKLWLRIIWIFEEASSLLSDFLLFW